MTDFGKYSEHMAELKFCFVVLLVGILVPALAGCAGNETVSKAGTASQPEEDSSEFDMPSEEFISPGMTIGELKSLVGQPEEIEQLGGDGSEAWYYDFGVVIVKGGKVQYKHPPSRAADKEPPS